MAKQNWCSATYDSESDLSPKFDSQDDGGCPVVSPVSKELREAQSDLVARLKSEHGVVAQRVNLRGFYHSFRMWNSMMDNEKVSYSDE